MNYFNKAEKTLKSCLKEKLSITTATVVGFLIAGTVAFGATITQEDINKSSGVEIAGSKTVISTTDKENTINETLENKKSDEKKEENGAVVSSAGWLVTVTNGDLTIGEKGVLKGTNLSKTTLNLYGNTNTVNNGTIETAQNGWGAITLTAIDDATGKLTNNGKIDGNVNVEGNVVVKNTKDITGSIYSDNNKGNKIIDITNSGNIATTKENKVVKANNADNSAIFINGTKGELRLVNEGTIGNKKLDNGIVVQAIEKLDLTNNKDIIAKQSGIISSARETNIKNTGKIEGGKFGIYLSKGISLKYNIENSGTIEVTQEQAGKTQVIGMNLEGTGVAVNTTNGVIRVTGQGYDNEPKLNIIGVNVGGGEFINNGLIELGEGTTYGIGINVGENGKFPKKGKATNNGTIALEIGSNGIDRKASSHNIAIRNKNGEAINKGKIQVTDKTADELKGFDMSNLFEGVVANKGMLVDKDGNIVSQKDDVELDGDLTIDQINGAGDLGGAIVINGDSTITGGKDSITTDGLNIAGSTVTIKNDTSSNGVTFDGTTLNLAKSNDVAGKIVIGEKSSKADLTIANGTINGVEGNTASDIELTDGSSLTLNGTTVNGNIGTVTEDTVLAQAQTGATVNVLGESALDGRIDVATINVGNDTQPLLVGEISTVERKNKFVLSSDSVIGKGKTEVNPLENSSNNTINIKDNGQLVLEVGTKGETALGNSTGITITGTNTEAGTKADGSNITVVGDTNGDILLSTGNLTGTGINVDLGSGNTFTNTSVSMENGNNGVYTATAGENNSIKLDYNKELFKDNGAINAINNGAMNANNLFENSNLAIREQQMKNIYEGSIYSETVRASYNSVKTFENVLRGMNTVNETGKWTAFGSGVYAKDSYDRIGHDSEIETTGLLAGAEYGLANNTSVGFTFAGANQDVDSLTGTADGTTLYLGTYAKKVVGNYKFMAGLGYQYGDYDADNVTGYATSSDSYNSNTLSVYVEGRYSMDLGSNIAFEPKLKLGYTYVDQDDTRDANFGVSDASLSTFDTELGADLIKTYVLKDGKANLVLGASYVRAMGDTDKEFTGEFTKSNGGFDIKGAELSENTGKFDLSVEVSKDNGFFYNGGLNLHVGSDDYRNYGVNFGAGYKF